MKRSREPGWWTAASVVSVLIGIAFWVAVVWVAWHFIAKYW
jgi:hypothetical protein